MSLVPLRVPVSTQQMFNKHSVDVNSGKIQLFDEDTILDLSF